MVQGKLIPKRKLEMVKVLEEKGYGSDGKTLQPVMAADHSLPEDSPMWGKPIKFVIFNPTLRTHVTAIEPGKFFTADYEERERPGSEYGPDRTIVQVYDDKGEPISKKGGNKGSYGKSPDTIKLEYALRAELEKVKHISIEGQNALTNLVALLSSPISSEDKYWDLAMDTIKAKIERYMANNLDLADIFRQMPTFGRPEPQNPTPAATKSESSPIKDEGKGKLPTDIEIKNVGQLFTMAQERGLNRRDVFSVANCGTVEELKGKDFEMIWAEIDRTTKVTQPT